MSGDLFHDILYPFAPKDPPGKRGGLTVVEGRVHSVTVAGMFFTVPTWDKGKHRFGPAPWPAATTDAGTYAPVPHSHTLLIPPAGARCLILFAPSDGGEIGNPWCLAWWPAV
jgi:hypothetical protein